MRFFDLPPRTITLIAILLGFLMIDDLTSDEQDTLGNFLQLIGQTLETNSAQAQLLDDRKQDQKMKEMEDRIKQLEKKVG